MKVKTTQNKKLTRLGLEERTECMPESWGIQGGGDAKVKSVYYRCACNSSIEHRVDITCSLSISVVIWIFLPYPYYKEC